MLYFLNTAILPNTGKYECKAISLEEAINIWKNANEKLSAIGHSATVQVLNELGFDLKENRVAITMEQGDGALIFKLKQRLPEGKILSKSEIEDIGYEFWFLFRI